MWNHARTRSKQSKGFPTMTYKLNAYKSSKRKDSYIWPPNNTNIFTAKNNKHKKTIDKGMILATK